MARSSISSPDQPSDGPRRRKDRKPPRGGTEGRPRAGEYLLQLLDRDLLFRLIGVLVLYSLVPLGEVFLFVYIGQLIGNFLVLALAFIMSAVGALVAVGQVQRAISLLRARLEEGRFPVSELADLAGTLAGSIFLVTPGFVTDLCGYALLVPAVRRAVGRWIAGGLGSRFRDAWERLGPSQSLKIR